MAASLNIRYNLSLWDLNRGSAPVSKETRHYLISLTIRNEIFNNTRDECL